MAPTKRSFQATAMFSFLLIIFLSCSPIAVSARVHQESALKVLSPIGGSSSPFQGRTTAWNVKKNPSQQSTLRNQFANTEEDYDADSDVATREKINSFLTRQSRNSFIARVYAILSIQLIITGIACALFGLNPSVANLFLPSPDGQASLWTAVPLLSILASSVAWFRVSLSPEARRKSPNKWIWLGIFTLGESISVGFLSSLYKFKSVLTAMAATAAATTAVSTYTIMQKNPNRDLSQIGASLSSWAVILLAYLVVGLLQNTGILPANFIPFSEMIYSGLAACLFSAFLAYHTKLIVGGKHAKYRMNEKDYVYGAMALYSDIISMFLYILRLLGEDREQ